jgi:hypothetical protein
MSKHWGVSVRVFRRARTIGFTFMLLLVAGAAASAGEKEPAAVLELGAASTWDVGGGFTFGPSAALEFEPIKNDLVIEAGFTPFFDKGGRAYWDFVTFYSGTRSTCRTRWSSSQVLDRRGQALGSSARRRPLNL